MPTIPNVLLEVLQASTQIQSTNQDVSYSEVAAVTLLTWDIVTSLSDEVQLIWARKWSLAKTMYFALRYVPWLFELALLAINADGSTGLRFSRLSCKMWMAAQAVMLQLTITTVDVLLITRIYALFNKNVKLLACLSICFAGEVVFLCYVLSQVTPKLTYDEHCFVTSSPSLFVAYWITSLAFETILFLLTLVKFVDAVRQGWGRRSVMQQFVADGTWVYALLFVTLLLNMMLYEYVHTPFVGICFTWLLTVISCAGSRLVLNPRRRSESMQRALSTIELDEVPRSPAVLVFSPYSPGGSYRTSYKTSIAMTSDKPDVECLEEV